VLVIVASDHGEGLGDHGEQGHGMLVHEETMRAVLLAHLPGRLEGGRVIESLVSLADIASTVL
jgi:arylsulfatase A-like enzyme